MLIAVKEGLQVTRRGDLERDGVELVVAQINKANNKPVILYVYYRPPRSSSDGLNLLNNSLLSNPESSCIVLVGDFNITMIQLTLILVDARTMKYFVNLSVIISYNNS